MTAFLAAAAIIMEGDHDCRFMRQYLGHLGFGSLLFGGDLKNADRAEKIIVRKTEKGGGDGPLIGKNAPSSNVINICESSDNILIVADANSAFEGRLKKLQTTARKITEKTDAKVKIFLLPDNKSAGMLENLLEDISVGNEVYECLKQYEECLHSKNPGFNKLDMKAKIYAYCDAHGIPADGKKREYLDKAHWDLNHPKLDGLRKFLLHNLPSPPDGE